VEHFLKQSLAERREQSIAIAATVREQAQGYGLVLQVGTTRGVQTRELAHADCRELAEAGALVTALAIDPSLVVDDGSATAALPDAAAAQPSSPVATPPTPAAAPTSDAPASAPRARMVPTAPGPNVPEAPDSATAKLHPSLVALASAGNGALPGVGPAFGASVAAGPGRWRLALRGLYWLERFQSIAGPPGAGASLRSWAVGARACAVPVSAPLGLWACLGADMGQLRAKGAELDENRTARDRWSAISAELVAVYTVSSGVTTLLGFELGRALDRPRFGISSSGRDLEVFQAPEWIAQASLGFGFSLASSK
jgi:hypothetical protein